MIHFTKTLNTKFTKTEILNSKAIKLYNIYKEFKKSNDFAKEVLARLEGMESNESNNKATRYFIEEESETSLNMQKSLKAYNDFKRVNNLQ